MCGLLPQFRGAVPPGGVWLEHSVSVNFCLHPEAHSFHKKARLHSQLGKSLVSFSLQHAGTVPVHTSSQRMTQCRLALCCRNDQLIPLNPALKEVNDVLLEMWSLVGKVSVREIARLTPCITPTNLVLWLRGLPGP